MATATLDRAVYRSFSEIFEREVAVFFVATGTAANSLSLAVDEQAGRRRPSAIAKRT